VYLKIHCVIALQVFFDPQMVQNIALKLDKSVSETEQLLKNLSGIAACCPREP